MEYTVIVAGDAAFGTFTTYQLADQFAGWSGFVDYYVSPLLDPEEIDCELEIAADFSIGA